MTTQTRDVNRSATAIRILKFEKFEKLMKSLCVLANFTAYRPPSVTFENFRPHQPRVSRGRSYNDESLKNTETFRELLS